GAGFIGSNLVAALNAQGERDILIVDHLGRDEKWKNLRGLRFEDYLDKGEFRELLRARRLDPPETVFHLGACSSTTETDAGYLADNNYRYSKELCLWSLEQDARFIYASSAATYGDGSEGYDDDDEATPRLSPLNMYGLSKQMFDLWALERGILDRIVGLKYFNVYGPREDHKGDMRSVAHKAFHQIRERGEVGLFKSYRPDCADGEQVRDFIYVNDAVDVTLHFRAAAAPGGLYNCGTGRARSWLDLARAVFAGLGQEPRIGFIAMPAELRSRYQYHTEARTEKLRAAGYTRPFTRLEDGIADYVRSHLAGQG
ncbi:MAG: ADP-glyceromanno-heptose 6-epimerase, partial [Candidatus Eisenbacteria sp.]|nr:ADP-glyceromanno-heptose 6-epimerase [Candidatus Eisenbacteria bacterium]